MVVEQPGVSHSNKLLLAGRPRPCNVVADVSERECSHHRVAITIRGGRGVVVLLLVRLLLMLCAAQAKYKPS